VENKLVKDIQRLEKSLPFAGELEKISPELKKIGEGKKETYNELQKIDKLITAKEAEIQEVRAQMDAERD